MLLQFPTRPSTLTALRQLARDRFRDRYREPVIRRYGAETGDLGVFAVECTQCGAVDAVLKDFSFLQREASVEDLRSALNAAALTQDDWRPEGCLACGAQALEPVVAILARYLPENGAELQLELPFIDGAARPIELFAVQPGGSAQPLPSRLDALAFQERVGAPLSVRALWRAFVDGHLGDDGLAMHDVQPGYCLALRPFTDDPHEAATMFEGLEAQLQQRRGAWDVVTFLNDREEDGIPVTRGESYHGWLEEFAHEVHDGLIAPFVVADSGRFVEAVAELAARRGLFLEPDDDPETLLCRIGAGESMWEINLGPSLFKTLHEGLSFQRGAYKHLERPLGAMGEAIALPEVLRTCFPTWVLTVQGGGKFELVGDGQLFGGDLVALATAYDFTTPEGLEALLLHLGRHCRR